MNRNALLGAIVWLGLLLATGLRKLELDGIELMFLFAPLVIVPLGLELTNRVEQVMVGWTGHELGRAVASAGSGGSCVFCASLSSTGKPLRGPLPARLVLPSPERIACFVQLPCALAATTSFFVARGRLAASLAAAWLVFSTLLALCGALRVCRGGLHDLDAAFPVAAFLYLPIGSAWLVASRWGLRPMTFEEPVVLLTAVHFHYAGFAASLLARSARMALTRSRMRPTQATFLNSIAVGVLIGPGMLAAGFVIGPRVKILAALALSVSEMALALLFLLALRRPTELSARLLIALAAGSVVPSMVLAGLWAVGEYPLQPFVHLSEMARFHGTANAFGFTLCGLVGWARHANGTRRTE